MPDVPTPIPRSVVQVPPADTPGVQGLLTLAVAVVIVAGLYLGREVMIPIILAVLLSFLLAPVANFLRRLHLGRVPSALLAVVLALGIILMFGTVIGSQLADLAQEVPRYASSVERKVETLQSHTLGRITTIMRSLGHELDRASTPENASSGAATPSASPGEERKSIPVEVHEPQPSSVQLAQRIISPIVAPLATTAIVFIVAIFILLQREDLRDRLIRLFGSSDLHRTTVAMNDAARRLSNYFLTQLAINAMFGVIIDTRTVLHWCALSVAVGRARDGAALRALHWRASGGPVADRAGRRGRSWLVDGSVDSCTLCRCRGDHGPSGGTASVWP